MTAAQAAAKVRNAIKKSGNNPRGCVRVVNSDYTTEVEVDLRGIYGEPREMIDDVINNLPAGDFSWNVH